MTLTIGKLAKACEVNIDTVRYYERVGLILPEERTGAGYRVYDQESIRRLQFIKRAQSLGFTLEEIKQLQGLSEKSNTDCADIRNVAQAKIKDIEHRMHDLNQMKESLQKLAKHCPGKGKPLSECNILDYFYGGKK